MTPTRTCPPRSSTPSPRARGSPPAALLPDRRLRHRQVPPADRPGTAAAENGYRVRYTTAAALVNELVEAADDKTLSRTIARYGRIDLLCLDELGYLELDRRGAELLFQVFTEREERASIAIASNAAFSKAHMFTATCARQRRNDTRSSLLVRRS